MTAFVLRAATPEDAAALGDIAARTFVEAFGYLHAPAGLQVYLATNYAVEQMRKELEDPQRYTAFAYPAGDLARPCGYVMLNDGGVRPGDTGRPSTDYVEIKRVYVDSEFHGKGVAHELMRRVLEVVERKKRPIVWLGVWAENHRARRFYEKYGFQETGLRWFRVGTVDHPDLVYTLNQEQSKPPSP